MKLAIILNSTDSVLMASRYKYTKLLRDIYGKNIQTFNEHNFIRAKVFNPDYYVVFGSFRKTFKLPLLHKKPYILCDHDIQSLYRPNEAHDERIKIINAKKIIFTSPDHRDYICNKYKYAVEKTFVLYLRPSIEDINFEPLPKLSGKNLVYIGGLLDDSFPNHSQGMFAYRCYADIFKAIINQGWNVHLYPARKRPGIYANIGCTYHKKIDEGKELFRELSQYSAGLQGFGIVDKSFEYAKTCRPNKIWNYLAAGIPTIGINPGNGIELYNNKWGYELTDINKINDLELSSLNIAKHRTEEIIEKQASELKEFIESK